MFKFGKSKQKTPALDPLAISPELEKRIHVMPQRFYVAPKKKRSARWLIIILGMLLLAGLAGVAVWFIYLSPSQSANPSPINQPVVNENINQPVNTNENLNVNLNQNTNNNTNSATTTDLNLNNNANANSNLNANLNENVNINTNINITKIEPLPLAAGDDSDGLTAAEEALFGTNYQSSDTDGDTYADGAELLSGYDPTKAGGTLAQSNLFSTYNHLLYSIIYPQGWKVREDNPDKSEILFVASNNEFVEVLIIPNPNKFSLVDWYHQEFPQVDLDQAISVKINNLTGLRHPDNQSYYLMNPQDKSNIYLLHYNSGNSSATNFMATFQAMVKSFKLVL